MVALGLAVIILKVLWKIFIFMLKVSLVVGLIGLAITLWPVTLTILAIYMLRKTLKRIKVKKAVNQWINEETAIISEEEIDRFMGHLTRNVSETDNNNIDSKFDDFNLPLGRVNAFLNYYDKSIENEEGYYYSAIRSKDSNELREYGTLITRKGILFSRQYIVCDEQNDSIKTVENEDENIEFEKMLDSMVTNDKLILRYIDVKGKKIISKVVQQEITTIPLEKLNEICNAVIEKGVPKILWNDRFHTKDEIKEYQMKKIYEAEKANDGKINQGKNDSVVTNAGTFGAAVAHTEAYNEVKNYMNGSRGHGYGAEYANNTIDKLTGHKVKNIAQQLDENNRQVKHGADRNVDGVNIQTKYYQSANESIGAAFEHKQAIYLNDDKVMMQIEVPRDQYAQACELMQKRIDSGQVPNIKPGEDATDYVRKGRFTYAQSFNICKAGNIESLKVDIVNGVISSSYAGGISAMITFGISMWNGADVKESAKASMRVGFKVLGRGTMIYTLTMQLSREQISIPFTRELSKNGTHIGLSGINNPIFSASENIANSINTSALAQTSFGRSIGMDNVTVKSIISKGVTTTIVFGPDICRALVGRISTKQLFKNSVIGVSGIGAASIGQALIPIPVVGAMIGGAVGGFIAKNILDEFIEDDAKEMFQILKEEFLDVVMLSGLSKDEFDKVIDETLGNSKLPSMLRDMYASSEYRKFARDAIVSVVIISIISMRDMIEESTVEQGYLELLKEIG
jgi:hypothetical protein